MAKDGAVEFKLLGDEELKLLFKEINNTATNKRLIVAAGRDSARVFKNAAKAIIRPVSKGLAKSIGDKPSKKYPGGVWSGVRRDKFKGWMGHWYEWGTSERRTKQGSYRGKITATPFIRPAWDSTKGIVSKSYTETINKAIVKAIARKKKLKVKIS